MQLRLNYGEKFLMKIMILLHSRPDTNATFTMNCQYYVVHAIKCQLDVVNIRILTLFNCALLLSRQEIIASHYESLAHRLRRKDAFDQGESSMSMEEEKEDSLWFPAGVPLWRDLHDGVVNGDGTAAIEEPYDANWMNAMDNITTKELHQAAALIQRFVSLKLANKT